MPDLLFISVEIVQHSLLCHCIDITWQFLTISLLLMTYTCCLIDCLSLGSHLWLFLCAFQFLSDFQREVHRRILIYLISTICIMDHSMEKFKARNWQNINPYHIQFQLVQEMQIIPDIILISIQITTEISLGSFSDWIRHLCFFIWRSKMQNIFTEACKRPSYSHWTAILKTLVWISEFYLFML